MSIAHRLRHRITIDQLATTRDEFGGVVKSWATVAIVPAEVYPLSGREFVAAQAEQAGVTTRITIRYQAGIEPAMRITHDGRTYNIKAVLPDPTLRRHIALMCETGITKD
jgi:SPP1 family predicted phage head-tail adaptor